LVRAEHRNPGCTRLRSTHEVQDVADWYTARWRGAEQCGTIRRKLRSADHVADALERIRHFYGRPFAQRVGLQPHAPLNLPVDKEAPVACVKHRIAACVFGHDVEIVSARDWRRQFALLTTGWQHGAILVPSQSAKRSWFGEPFGRSG